MVMLRSNMHTKGFTIVELLVVIVVIGILAAITIVSYSGISQKAVVSSIQSDLSNASKKLKLFEVMNGSYPETINCTVADSSTNICIRSSGSNSFAAYGANNTASKSFYLQSKNGTTCYSITNDSTPVASCVWLPGRTGTAMSGKLVYYQNLASTAYTWGPVGQTCPSTHCATNVDPGNPTYNSLLADNSISFTSYPARDACKTDGGRLPTISELAELYTRKNSGDYGDNFGTSFYLSSAEYDSNNNYALQYSFNTGNPSIKAKNSGGASIRCVR